MPKVLVFGVFDGLHAGHRALFREARKYEGKLVVVLTPDSIVRALKHHYPEKPFSEREKVLRAEAGVDDVVAGDAVLGSWEVIKRLKPEIIVLGYDQQALKTDLERYMKESGIRADIKVAPPHEPEKYHSSIINK